jgi:hypothetical protein
MRGLKWALIFEWRRDFPELACRLGCFLALLCWWQARETRGL